MNFSIQKYHTDIKYSTQAVTSRLNNNKHFPFILKHMRQNLGDVQEVKKNRIRARDPVQKFPLFLFVLCRRQLAMVSTQNSHESDKRQKCRAASCLIYMMFFFENKCPKEKTNCEHGVKDSEDMPPQRLAFMIPRMS